jgi:feruloyl esterase
MAWVEKDVAPEHIIPTKWKNDTDPSQGVLKQRPICKFPAEATYVGHGNVNASSSWKCVAQG